MKKIIEKYNIRLFTTIFFSSLFYVKSVNGQNTFNVTIHFKDTSHYSQLEFQYDNGLQQVKINPTILDTHSFLIKNKFYSRFGTIFIILHNNDGSVLSYNYFWVTDTPATIIYSNKLINETSLDNPLTSHAIELKNRKTVKELNEFYSNQKHDYDSLFSKYRVNPEDTVIANKFARANTVLHDKQMSFIKLHGNSYYCFWLFQREIRYNFFSANTLLKIFNSAFPTTFQLSVEGRRIKKELANKILVHEKYAADFKSKDIKGDTIYLKKFRGKYVLLHFWAPWCVPCMAEIPDIVKIKKVFPNTDLEIISVCLKSDIAQFYSAIRKFNMNWINIFDNEDIINEYSVSSIPQVFLINKDGKIIYSEYSEYSELDLKSGRIDKRLSKLWNILNSKL